MLPPAPTNAPVIISRELFIIKPTAVEAKPEPALSKEITIGISAPPMRKVIKMPKAHAVVVKMPKFRSEALW